MDNSIKIDYLEFTLFMGLEKALKELNLSIDEFTQRSCGRNGYKAGLTSLINDEFIVLYDGNEGMGTHFVFSGSVVSLFYKLLSRKFDYDGQMHLNFADSFNAFKDWFIRLDSQEQIKISRLDMAFDDYHFMDMDMIYSAYRNGLINTNWRTFDYNRSEVAGKLSGLTYYFGSRKSEVFLRIYDKKLEQKNTDVSLWTRFEFQMKNKYATSFLRGLFESDASSLDNYAKGLFDRYFTIDSDEFRTFLGDVSLYKIGLPAKTEKTLSKMANWLETGVAPSLKTLVLFCDGNLEPIYRMIEEARPRKDTMYIRQDL